VKCTAYSVLQAVEQSTLHKSFTESFSCAWVSHAGKSKCQKHFHSCTNQGLCNQLGKKNMPITKYFWSVDLHVCISAWDG